MSALMHEPASELGHEFDAVILQVADELAKLSEQTRDIIFYRLAGVTDTNTAHDLRIHDVSAIEQRYRNALKRLPFPAHITEAEKTAILRKAQQLADSPTAPPPKPREEKPVSVAPAPKAVSPPTPAPVPPKPPAPPVVVAKAVSTPAPVVAPKPAAPVAPAPVPAPAVQTSVASGVRITGMMVEVPINRLQRYEDQPRKEFDELVIHSLSASIKKVGQLMPALLIPIHGKPGIDYQIVDGECRWIASKRAGLAFLSGVVYPGLSVEDAKKLYEISVMANFGRSQHTDLELAYAADKMMRDKQWTVEEAAEAFCKTAADIRRHLRLLKLDPSVQALMRVDVPESQRLKVNQALYLVDYPTSFQQQVAKEMSDQGLKDSKSGWYIRQRSAELDVVADRSRKGRRPANDARTIERGLTRFRGLVKQYREFPNTTITQIFHNRPSTERDDTVKLIDSIREDLERIRDGIVKSETAA